MAESTCRGHEALSLKQMIILKVVELKVFCEDTNIKPRPGMKKDTEMKGSCQNQMSFFSQHVNEFGQPCTQ